MARIRSRLLTSSTNPQESIKRVALLISWEQLRMSSMAVFRFVSFSFASLLIAMASAITTSMFWSIIFFLNLENW